MARKKRLHTVNTKAGGRNDVSLIGKITREQLLKLTKAADRKIRLEQGIDLSAGTGAHGGTKEQARRRARRRAHDEARSAVNEAANSDD